MLCVSDIVADVPRVSLWVSDLRRLHRFLRRDAFHHPSDHDIGPMPLWRRERYPMQCHSAMETCWSVCGRRYDGSSCGTLQYTALRGATGGGGGGFDTGGLCRTSQHVDSHTTRKSVSSPSSTASYVCSRISHVGARVCVYQSDDMFAVLWNGVPGL